MAKTRKNKNKSYDKVHIPKTSDALLFDGIYDDRSKRKILILCEGETEVNYFQGVIKSTLYSSNCKFVVPTQTQYNSAMQILLTAAQILKICYANDKKKYKQFDDFLIQNKQELQLEDDNKLKSPLLKIDSTIFQTPFEEVWLVFDADDRLNATVFEKVKELGFYIAFSNRQWENWALLHFEENSQIFTASECEVDKEKVGCGKDNSNIPFANCEGKICVIGYLRQKGYHPNYTKGGAWTKQNDRKNYHCFEGLLPENTNFQKPLSLATEKVAFDKIKTAIKNSLWLREQQNFPKPENSQNPYTDVAILVALLMKEPIEWKNYEVVENKEIINHQGFMIKYLSVDTINSIVRISITNLSSSSMIINAIQSEKFNIIEETIHRKNFIKATNITPTKILIPNASEVFEITFDSQFSNNVKLRYQVDNYIFVLSR